jgi:ABC-2 type transport system ATP-binding protein
VPAIRVENLVKEFKRPVRKSGSFGTLRSLFSAEYETTRAVDGVSFEIEPGELVGYLGPNGAGKSTTIKMLTGVLVPTSGLVEVTGAVPWRDRRRNARQIGAVFGQRSQLWWDLPLRDSFELISTLYDIEPAAYRNRLAEFTEILQLGEFLDRPVRQLSLGQRMRGDLVAAMLYGPRLLYLDEPTVGLDVVAQERIREFVAHLNAESGTTVILTTHDLDDVERLCRRILIIDHGRVLYDGDIQSLKAVYAPYRDLVVTLAEAGDVAVPSAEQVARVENVVTLRFRPTQVSAPDLIAAVTSRYAVVDLAVVDPELDGVIRRIYTARALPDPDLASTAQQDSTS